MSSQITDIWFRSARSLDDLVDDLGLVEAGFDAENYWEWAIGKLGGVELDVTRTHTVPPEDADTRVFRVDRLPFDPALEREVVSRLGRRDVTPMYCGRWIYLRGNDFRLDVMREHDSG